MTVLDPRGTISIHKDNVRDVTFQLRRTGRREPFDVTGQLLRLTAQRYETETEEALEPIDADPLHPDADFANGKVVITVDERITEEVGTYEYALTLRTATEEITLQTGYIQVRERPGFPGGFKIEGAIEAGATLEGTFVFP